MQKKVLAVHDISGVGRCSLTVALPVISVMGVETSVLPTAVLSTHTGGFSDYTFRDLTKDILPMLKHWEILNLKFDGIYTGYLASLAQVDMIKEVIAETKRADTVVFIDPVMADHGKLYKNFDKKFVGKMRELCQEANVITPNITEACLLLDVPYQEPPYTPTFIADLVDGLGGFGVDIVCLTGVQFNDDEVGAAVQDTLTGETTYTMTSRIDQEFHGTGDLFSSILFGSLIADVPLPEATRLAVDYTRAAIERTLEVPDVDVRFGVEFEPLLAPLGTEVAKLSRS